LQRATGRGFRYLTLRCRRNREVPRLCCTIALLLSYTVDCAMTELPKPLLLRKRGAHDWHVGLLQCENAWE
jgi:hypothetical protein